MRGVRGRLGLRRGGRCGRGCGKRGEERRGGGDGGGGRRWVGWVRAREEVGGLVAC